MSSAALEFDSVSLKYSSEDPPALREASLRVPSGTVVGLVGVNGAGKTTFLDIAVGSLIPSRGSVRWFGEPELTRPVRARIGFCPDVPDLPEFLTGRETLGFFGGLRGLRRDVVESRARVLIERLDLGDIRDKRVGALSRGNKVRLGIAQTLIGQPDLILLDESFGHLDPLVQKELRALLKDEAERGAAVIVSSHQLDQIQRISDRVHVIHRGRISPPVERQDYGGSLEALLLKQMQRLEDGS